MASPHVLEVVPPPTLHRYHRRFRSIKPKSFNVTIHPFRWASQSLRSSLAVIRVLLAAGDRENLWQRKARSQKCESPFQITPAGSPETSWLSITVYGNHNHPPSPPSVIPRARRLPTAAATQMQEFAEGGVSTADQLQVDLGEKEFSSGLTFVAISRVKSLRGLAFKPGFRCHGSWRKCLGTRVREELLASTRTGGRDWVLLVLCKARLGDKSGRGKLEVS